MQVLTVVSSKYNKGEVKWEPKDIQGANIVIEQLQRTILNKDKRILAISDQKTNMEIELELLYKRVSELRDMLAKFGLKII